MTIDKTRQDKTRQDKTRQDKHSRNYSDCQVVVLGQMDNTIDNTFESANRVYDSDNLCPTIPTCAGGNIQPKVIARCVGGLSQGKWGGAISSTRPRLHGRYCTRSTSDYP